MNCAVTVEDGSHCGTNDACYNREVVYFGMMDCEMAWKQRSVPDKTGMVQMWNLPKAFPCKSDADNLATGFLRRREVVPKGFPSQGKLSGAEPSWEKYKKLRA
ncbi:MAG: hypothetical protein IK099_10845 [Clostridia bacterium]|nr:hypothetical protein [Clostridia bacterium]